MPTAVPCLLGVFLGKYPAKSTRAVIRRLTTVQSDPCVVVNCTLLVKICIFIGEHIRLSVSLQSKLAILVFCSYGFTITENSRL